MAVSKRELIGGVTVIVVSVITGRRFFDGEDEDPMNDLPEGIEDAQFEWSRERTAEVDDDEYLPEDKPRIQLNEQTNEVEVSGVLTYGSSTCNAITVEKIRSNGSTNELHVEIGWEEDRSDGVSGCTDDLDFGSYSLSLLYDTALPSDITVVERHLEPAEDDDEMTVSNRIQRT